MSEDILSLVPPPADHRLAYGTDLNQFGDLRLPKDRKPAGVVMNIHGGFWRAKYDLLHAGHLCAALTARGCATWNIEYRRVGNSGGGWPGTFEDISNACRFLSRVASRYSLDLSRFVVMGHSAGAQLALCLAAHERSVRGVVSLAGVVDLRRAFDLHLSNDAVVEFLGGKPGEVVDHYQEADPMRFEIPAHCCQILIHGSADDTVPPAFSREYVTEKKKTRETVEILEIAKADHYDLIDPRSAAWPQIEAQALRLLSS